MSINQQLLSYLVEMEQTVEPMPRNQSVTSAEHTMLQPYNAAIKTAHDIAYLT